MMRNPISPKSNDPATPRKELMFSFLLLDPMALFATE